MKSQSYVIAPKVTNPIAIAFSESELDKNPKELKSNYIFKEIQEENKTPEWLAKEQLNEVKKLTQNMKGIQYTEILKKNQRV